jgi:hypothetical protein
MFFSGLFGGFLRSGFAAPFAFWPESAAPKTRLVHTNSSILHQKGNCKSEAGARRIRLAKCQTRRSCPELVEGSRAAFVPPKL